MVFINSEHSAHHWNVVEERAADRVVDATLGAKQRAMDTRDAHFAKHADALTRASEKYQGEIAGH